MGPAGLGEVSRVGRKPPQSVLRLLVIALVILTCIRLVGAAFVHLAPGVIGSEFYLEAGDLFFEVAFGLVLAMALVLALYRSGWTRWVGLSGLMIGASVLLRFTVGDTAGPLRLLTLAAYLGVLAGPFVAIAVVVGGVRVGFFQVDSAHPATGE
jgi:hypothetical protein